MGMKKDPRKPRRTLKRTAFKCKNGGLKRGKPLRKVGRTKRGREIRLLPFLKKLVVQTYCDSLGVDREEIEGWDLEHILGHHGTLNGVPVEISVRCLQLLDRFRHNLKTEGILVSKTRDFRDKRVEAALYEIAEKLEEPFKDKPFDLKEYGRAVKALIR